MIDKLPYLGPLLAPLVAGQPVEAAAELTDICGETPAGGALAVLALKSAIDRAASACRGLHGPSSRLDVWLRIAREVDAARRLFTARGWIDEPQTYHETPPPLDAVRLVPKRSRGLRFLALSFDSGYRPRPEEPGRDRWISYEACRTGHAWVLRHARGPRPWLVCVHGYGMGIPLFDFEAFAVGWLHCKLGLNVVLPVLPLHGPRKIGRISGERFLDSDLLDTIHAEAQAVWDIRRILSWIRSQDPSPVGVYGLSLGGYTASLLAGQEADLACVIAGIPATDFLRLALLHNRSSSLRTALRAGLEWDKVAEVLRVVSPLAVPSRIPRERLFMFAGTGDRIVPRQHVAELWRHWRCPRIAWYQGSHFSFLWERLAKALVREALSEMLIATAGDSPQAAAA